MEVTIHVQVLCAALATGVVLGAVVNKTNFCTLGAVSDWVNMGDTGRIRAWLLAIAVAIAGVTGLEAIGLANLGVETFPPYRTANFAWLRYLTGGVMFGIGMTLASGCGNKTLVRLGGGNLKSIFVLAIASLSAYPMLWTDFYGLIFAPAVTATSIDLAAYGFHSQSLGELAGVCNTVAGSLLALSILLFVFKGKEFRQNADNILGGVVVGLAVTVGWYVTGGAMGVAWKEFAEFADVRPLRVETQSLTFVSPMGDLVRYLSSPRDFSLLNFGIMAMAGVVLGSFLYSVSRRQLRLEWFADGKDFLNHSVGAALMGIGGVLAMGCTIGQGVTGVSTLAVGSILAFLAMVAGAAGTMKFIYWRMLQTG